MQIQELHENLFKETFLQIVLQFSFIIEDLAQTTIFSCSYDAKSTLLSNHNYREQEILVTNGKSQHRETVTGQNPPRVCH